MPERQTVIYGGPRIDFWRFSLDPGPGIINFAFMTLYDLICARPLFTGKSITHCSKCVLTDEPVRYRFDAPGVNRQLRLCRLVRHHTCVHLEGGECVLQRCVGAATYRRRSLSASPAMPVVLT